MFKGGKGYLILTFNIPTSFFSMFQVTNRWIKRARQTVGKKDRSSKRERKGERDD